MTKTPATWLGVYDKVGSLDEGKLANFLITTGPLFNEKTNIIENWVQGEKYEVKEEAWTNVAGTYNLVLNTASGTINYTLDVKNENTANVIAKDTLTGKFSYDGKLVKLSFSTTPQKKPQGQQDQPKGGGKGGASIRLSGVNNGDVWQGNGVDTLGNPLTWTATFIKANESVDSAKRKMPLNLGKVTYPFGAYGWDSLPHQENLLIKNARYGQMKKKVFCQIRMYW